MPTILKPPTPLRIPTGMKSLCLAGSIEQGTAANWQDIVTQQFTSSDLMILNPRRDHWDPTWTQDISNPDFFSQVKWELDAMERADLISMYFDPDTNSPITLLELGLYAGSGKLIVGCPVGYWRRGNVQMVCARYHVPLADTLGSLIMETRRRLGGLK